MKKILFVLILWLISGLSLADQEAGIYKYVHIASGSTIRLDVNEMKIILDGHSVLAVSDCVQKTGYRCLVSEGGSFVFPTGQLAKQMTWEFNGQEFNVVRKVSGQLFGRNYSGFIVHSRLGDDNYWYLFSPLNGLLAFGALGELNTSSTFILEGECGFAAQNGCKH